MTPAPTTNRRLLIAVAAIGVVAGSVGIGASLAGTDDEPTEEEEATREARLEAEAAVTRAEAEQIALGQAAGTVDRARISDETGILACVHEVPGTS